MHEDFDTDLVLDPTDADHHRLLYAYAHCAYHKYKFDLDEHLLYKSADDFRNQQHAQQIAYEELRRLFTHTNRIPLSDNPGLFFADLLT